MQVSDAHVLIAANPKSGASSGRSKVCELRAALEATGHVVEICDSLQWLSQRSAQLAAGGCLRAVVSAGGDGTAAAVVNLIPVGVPMAILPLGTENLLAKYLGLTSDVASVASAVGDGRLLQLDAGLAGGRLFLIMLGCGFDAEVVQQLHAAREGHISRWTYSKPIWRAVRSYQYPLIEVECDHGSFFVSGPPGSAPASSEPDLSGGEQPLQFSTAWLFAFNLPRYAANLPFCPQADGSDGYLDLCSFARGGTLRGLTYLTHLWLGRHQRLSDFGHVKAKRFRLRSQGVVPYQIDGDPGGTLPLDVEVLPGRLTVLVPK
ncbi:MAG: diacylglycerol/lipid kinase family protein [Aureliella sp.]